MAAPKFPRAKVLKYFELDAQRKQLEREAKSLKAQQEAIEAELEPIVSQADGRKIDREGFTLYITTRRCAVGWKQEFVKVKGDKAAEKLIQSQPTKDELVIERTK